MSLGDNIHCLRGERRLSQGELADLLEVSRQSVSKWETDASVPDLDKLVKLSQVFGVTLDELVQGAAPSPIQDGPTAAPISSPAGMPPRKIAGSILLGLWVLTVLLCTLMGGLLEGLLLAVPFLVCGVICFAARRHPGLFCAWAVYLLLDLYFRIATGITWRMIFLTPIFTPEMNYLRLAFAWVAFLLLVILVSVTVFRLGKQPLPLRRRDGWLLAGTLVIFLLLGLPLAPHWGWRGLYAILGRVLAGHNIMWLITAVLDLLQTVLFTTALTLGLRALRGRKSEKAVP